MTHFLDRPFAFSALTAPGLGPNGLMLCRCPGLRGGQPKTATPGSTTALEADLTLLASNGATDLVTLIGEDERGNLGVGALPRLAGEKGCHGVNSRSPTAQPPLRDVRLNSTSYLTNC